MRLHAILERSRANGPGIRTAIWVQGCTLACPGCFNPATHPREGGFEIGCDELIARCARDAEGVTLSGGEPLQQPAELLLFLQRLRERAPLSVVLFSGYTLPEILAMAPGPPILGYTDVLIAGRYLRERPLGRGLRGSANQTVHLLTTRYTRAEVERTPLAEIRIDPHACIETSGIRPWRTLQRAASRFSRRQAEA